MLNSLVDKLIKFENLTEDEAYELMLMIMDGKLTPIQITSALIALRMKGETAEEIAGFSKGMKDRAIKIKKEKEELVDVCGTGADNSNSYNISTLTAFVLAAAGVKVVKHGNKGISSKCGSADIIKALGIRIELTADEIIKSLHETNFAFIYAPFFHPAMKIVAPIRQELAIKTIFNVLGPLTNPADPDYQLVGVYDKSKAAKIAQYFLKENKKAFIIHSQNGWDEATSICPFFLIEVNNNGVTERVIEPQKIGFKKYNENWLKGGTIEENLRAAMEALTGSDSALKDTIVLNAALVFLLINKAKRMQDAIDLADSIIKMNMVMNVINKLKKLFPLN